MRSKEKDKKGSDKNSLLVIWLTIFICIPLAFYISNLYHFKIFATTTLNIGLAIIILGIFLRLIIIKSLGIFFTVDVTIKQNHTLRKDGFYKYLRHPSYFASLISFIGFGISLNNWISLSIIVIATFCAFLYRIRVEEKALIAYFGIEYLVYKKSTKTIIPFIY
ncbi:MAG: isoprenylcysteine carboxylmethyltransferase family protein [Bacteroidia bacterium]